MIIMISPHCNYGLLDIVIAEQAQYYGQKNNHIIDYLRYICTTKKEIRK